MTSSTDIKKPKDYPKLVAAYAAYARCNFVKAYAAQSLGIASSTLSHRVGRYFQIHPELKPSEQEIEKRQKDLVDEHKEVRFEREIRKLQEQKTTERRKRRIAERENDRLSHELECYQLFDQCKEDSSPLRIEPLGKGVMEKEAAANLILSDWHCEEVVDPKVVNGLNEFDLDICTARVESLWNQTLENLKLLSTHYQLSSLNIFLLGDFITGYIHEELQEGNALSPPEATVFAFDLIAGGIDFLLDQIDIPAINCICSVGNHGRTTKKSRVASMVSNSYEVILYEFLSRHYETDPRVNFKLPNGYFQFVDVYDTRIRAHHGDWVRYHGGVGGVTIPLNKAIGQWNTSRRADLDVLGHWHQCLDDRKFRINGSLIGWTPYAQKIKALYEPPTQRMFLIEPEKGVSWTNNLMLDENMGKK